MAKIGQPYSSANWLVKEGSADEFVSRWTAFVEWSFKNAPGLESGLLVQDSDNPRRFLSLGAWDTAEAMQAWRQMPVFQELFEGCRELCDEGQVRSYTLASAPSE
jgi:heme-degrading monooxygenase HmoA